MAEPPPYSGLDPSIVNYLQGGQQSLYVDPSTYVPPPPPPPPPSPGGDIYMHNPRGGTARLGQDDPTANYGLPATVATAVQNGFAPAPPAMDTGVTIPGAPQLASALPSEAGAAAPTAPADVLAGTVPVDDKTQRPTGGVTQAAPGTPGSTAAVAQLTPKQQADQAKAQAAYDALPENIAKRSEGMSLDAIEKERQAGMDAGAAEMAGNDAQAKATQASIDRQAEHDKLHAATQMKYHADVDKYTQQYMQDMKDAANFKVDTSRHMSNWGYLAIALSGIGDALDHRHGPNTALDIIEKGIDKRIEDQWAQKKSLGEKAEQSKNVLDVSRHNYEDDRQAQQMDRAAERDVLSNQLKLAAAQTANPAVKARMESASAKLDQSKAQIVMGEAQRKAQAIKDEQDQANKRAEIGVHYATLAQNERFHNDEYALKVAEASGARAAADLKLSKDQKDELVNRGVATPDGKNLMNAPDDPYLAPKERATEVQKASAAQSILISSMDRLRQLRDSNGGHIVDNADARKAVQNLSRAIMAIHEVKGITRFSGEVVDLMEKQLTGGADINSVIRSVMPNLDEARANAVEDYNSTLIGANYKGKPVTFADPLKAPKAEPTLGDLQMDKLLKDTGVHVARRYNKATGDYNEGRDIPIAPDNQERLDNLVAVAGHATDPKERANALDKLNILVKEAKSEDMRNAAKAGIYNAQNAGMGAQIVPPLTQTQQLPPAPGVKR